MNPQKTIEMTKEFLKKNPELVKAEMAVYLMVKESFSKEKALESARTLYAQLEDARWELSKTLYLEYGPFHGLSGDDPQWEVQISYMFMEIAFLCGIGDDGELYIRADVPNIPVKQQMPIRVAVET